MDGPWRTRLVGTVLRCYPVRWRRRHWGPIEGSSIIGKVVLMLWHDGHPDIHRFSPRAR